MVKRLLAKRTMTNLVNWVGNRPFGLVTISSIAMLNLMQFSLATWLGITKPKTVLPRVLLLKTTLPEVTVNSALNEFNFQAVATAYLTRYPEAKVPEGASPSEYYRLLKKAMLAWSQDELAHELLDETWGQFEDRVHSMLTHLQSIDAKRVLVVSSGGAIAMMLKHILGYYAATVVNMNLQIRNASFSQCFANARGVHLNNFNSVPHLDVIDRLHAITYS